jgi:hypothetical protein
VPQVDGANTFFSNNLYGIILDGPGTHDNRVRHTNLYSSGLDGIGERNGAGNNRWSQISTRNSGGLGIDKNASSDFTNDITPPYPVITSVVKSGGNITINGLASGSFLLHSTTVEVYEVATNRSGFGEGFTYRGVTGTDADGTWQLTIPAGASMCFTAFETDSGISLTSVWNYSSEFGPNTCRTYLPMTRK